VIVVLLHYPWKQDVLQAVFIVEWMLTLTLMILVHGGPVSNPSQTNIYWGDQLACP